MIFSYTQDPTNIKRHFIYLNVIFIQLIKIRNPTRLKRKRKRQLLKGTLQQLVHTPTAHKTQHFLYSL